MKQLRRIDTIRVTERDLREQVRTLCKLFGWKMYLTKVSLNDILYLCLIKAGKPVLNILANTVRLTVSSVTRRGISMIRQGMPTREQKSMVLQEFFGRQILRLFCTMMHTVITVAGAGRNCLLYMGKGNSGLTMLFHCTEAVKILRTILLPAVIPAMLQNGGEFVLSNGQDDGIPAKNVGQLQKNMRHGVYATAATNKTFRITEKEFSQQVEDLLNLFGWRWCHFRPARTEYGWRTPLSGYPGFLDYIAVKNRLIIFELKSENGNLTSAQEEWLDTLKACGQEVYLWRPADIEDIARLLRI